MEQSADPTTIPGRWDGLHAALRHIDEQIEWLYTQRGESGIRSRFAYPLLRLFHTGPTTVTALADSLGRSQSALSQTLSAMAREGLIESAPGDDARTRVVTLTERGRAVVPMLDAEWRATEALVAELDDELSCSLGAIAAELGELLAARPVRDRLEALMQRYEGTATPLDDDGRRR